jgi:GxxExxY protein
MVTRTARTGTGTGMIEPQMAQTDTDKASDGLHRDLSHSIIGAAMDVLNQLRPGLDEKLYERALALELKMRGHTVEQQKSFPVFYREQLIGNLVPDLIVDGLVVVDPKVMESFNESHVAQMLGYLAITRLNVALLLNFKFARLQTKRIVRD